MSRIFRIFIAISATVSAAPVHLIDEAPVSIRQIKKKRQPTHPRTAPLPTHAVHSANITCTGILAHESALKGGEIVHLPEWTHRA